MQPQRILKCGCNGLVTTPVRKEMVICKNKLGSTHYSRECHRASTDGLSRSNASDFFPVSQGPPSTRDSNGYRLVSVQLLAQISVQVSQLPEDVRTLGKIVYTTVLIEAISPSRLCGHQRTDAKWEKINFSSHSHTQGLYNCMQGLQPVHQFGTSTKLVQLVLIWLFQDSSFLS